MHSGRWERRGRRERESQTDALMSAGLNMELLLMTPEILTLTL